MKELHQTEAAFAADGHHENDRPLQVIYRDLRRLEEHAYEDAGAVLTCTKKIAERVRQEAIKEHDTLARTRYLEERMTYAMNTILEQDDTIFSTRRNYRLTVVAMALALLVAVLT